LFWANMRADVERRTGNYGAPGPVGESTD
jgi:hypothetical protein